MLHNMQGKSQNEHMRTFAQKSEKNVSSLMLKCSFFSSKLIL